MSYVQNVIFRLSDLSEQFYVGINRLFATAKITGALKSYDRYIQMINTISKETLNEYTYNKIPFETARLVFDFLVFDLNNHYSKIKFLSREFVKHEVSQTLMEKIKQCISSVKSHFTDYTANQSFLSPKQLKMIYSVERAKYFISPKKVEKNQTIN